MQKKQNLPLYVGMYILAAIMFTILVSTSFLVFKIPINIASLPIALILSAAAVYIFGNKSVKDTAIVSAIGIAVIIVCVLISLRVYDWSWDGNTYHKSMLAFLKEGWNPFYDTFYEYADRHFKFLSEVDETWYDAYPKGTEIWAACLYKIIGNIEAGKSFNLLGTVSAGLIAFDMLGNIKSLKKWQSGVCAALFVLNPVMLSQMFTYYNDGFLFQTILVCVICCLYLTLFEGGSLTNACYFLIFSTIGIGFNIKFSALIFFAIPCGVLFVYWCYKKWKEGFTKEGKKILLLRFSLMALSVIFGVVFTGASSYVINTFRYHNPVYTMIGEGSTDIMSVNSPEGFLGISGIAAFFISLFSRTTIYKELELLELKFPFALETSEINSAMACDTRIAGWGIFFSGILIISLVILCFAFMYYRKKRPELCLIAEIFALIALISVLFVPSMWWARYFVSLLYLPACAVMYLFIRSSGNEKNSAERIFAAGAITLLIIANMLPNIMKTTAIFETYAYQRAEIARLKDAAKTSDISVSCGLDDYKFYGRIFSLYDEGITEFTYDPNIRNDYSGMVFSDNRTVYYKVNKGIMATKNIPDFVKEAKKNENIVLFIAARYEASAALDEKTIEAMKSLGLKFDLKDKYGYSYLAVVDGDKVLHEQLANEKIVYSGIIDNKSVRMISAGYKTGDVAKITINSLEYALNGCGLNIVAYDKQKNIVVDKIRVNTHSTNILYRR